MRNWNTLTISECAVINGCVDVDPPRRENPLSSLIEQKGVLLDEVEPTRTSLPSPSASRTPPDGKHLPDRKRSRILEALLDVEVACRWPGAPALSGRWAAVELRIEDVGGYGERRWHEVFACLADCTRECKDMAALNRELELPGRLIRHSVISLVKGPTGVEAGARISLSEDT